MLLHPLHLVLLLETIALLYFVEKRPSRAGWKLAVVHVVVAFAVVAGVFGWTVSRVPGWDPEPVTVVFAAAAGAAVVFVALGIAPLLVARALRRRRLVELR